MRFYNRVILIGKLVEDPDTRFTPSGAQVTKLSLQINSDERSSEGRHPQTIEVIAFEKDRRPRGPSLSKGCNVLVEGKIQSRSWETLEGQKRRKLEIIAERVYPLTDEEGLKS